MLTTSKERSNININKTNKTKFKDKLKEYNRRNKACIAPITNRTITDPWIGRSPESTHMNLTNPEMGLPPGPILEKANKNITNPEMGLPMGPILEKTNKSITNTLWVNPGSPHSQGGGGPPP